MGGWGGCFFEAVMLWIRCLSPGCFLKLSCLEFDACLLFSGGQFRLHFWSCNALIDMPDCYFRLSLYHFSVALEGGMRMRAVYTLVVDDYATACNLHAVTFTTRKELRYLWTTYLRDNLQTGRQACYPCVFRIVFANIERRTGKYTQIM